MPFFRAYLQGEPGFTDTRIAPYPSLPNQVPIFLIPGILGNPKEFAELIDQIRNLGDKRDIFVWFDPLITPDLPGKNRIYKSNASLDKQTDYIIESILQDWLPPEGPAPYELVGYSYGCSLAALAAKKLQNMNKHTMLYLIDGVSPECAKQYFAHQSAPLTLDLINIVKYAAVLSHKSNEFNEQDINFDSSFVQALQKLSPLECIDAVASSVLSSCESIKSDLFAKYIKIAKQGIYNLINAPDLSPALNIDKIVALITKQTAEKYGSPDGGWKKHTHNFSIVEDSSLVGQDHRDLLKSGCELFLMSHPEKEDYKVSDMSHLFLYKDKIFEKIFYLIQQESKIIVREFTISERLTSRLEQQLFNQNAKSPKPHTNALTCKLVLDSTSQQGDTFPDNAGSVALSLEKVLNDELTPEKMFAWLIEFAIERFYPSNNLRLQESLSSSLSLQDNSATPDLSSTQDEITQSASETKPSPHDSETCSDNESSDDEKMEDIVQTIGNVIRKRFRSPSLQPSQPTKVKEQNRENLLSYRLRLFPFHACGDENTPPEPEAQKVISMLKINNSY